MENKLKHVHKFKLHTYKSGNKIFFCALPDCNKKLNPALALGKETICWRCGNPFILSDYSIRLVKPHCEGCHKSSKQVKAPFEYRPDNLVIPVQEADLQHPHNTGIPPNPLAERLSKALHNDISINMGDEDEEEI